MKCFLLFVCVSMLGLFACTKDGKNITVRGRVYNPVTGEGISDCEIRLLKTTPGSPGTSGGYEAVAKVTPDANGYYELNHTSVFGRYVGCYVDNNKYDQLGWVEDGIQTENTSFTSVKLGKITDLDFQAVEFAELIVHVRNDNCQGPNDKLELFLDGSQVGWDDVQIGLLTTLYGCIDIVDDPVEFPMGYRYYHWTATRGNNIETFYDTVYLQPNQPVTLDVYY